MARNYAAIDPQEQILRCKCGRPECRLAPMRSARHHAASLARAIYACSDAEALLETDSSSWSSVLFPLEMACGIENVQVDPTFAYDDDSWRCGTAWGADEQKREAASKYTAGLAIFNFVWAAYEAAIAAVCRNPSHDKLPVAGRNFFKSCAGQEGEILGFYNYLGLARTCCSKEPALWHQIDASLKKYSLSGAAAAASAWPAAVEPERSHSRAETGRR